MAEAVFLVDIDADQATIVEALTTQQGIVSWWTTDAEVSGSSLQLGFPEAPLPFSMRVDEVGPNKVVWSSAGEFPPHWVGTTVTWQLMDHPEASGSQLLFTHAGFAAPDAMLGHSSYTWALLMGHLKSYAESGIAKPFFA
ncbi:MAG: SRPBCC family protein [Acidimicrobiia bacterium]